MYNKNQIIALAETVKMRRGLVFHKLELCGALCLPRTQCFAESGKATFDLLNVGHWRVFLHA